MIVLGMRGREALVALVALVSLAAPASAQADLVGHNAAGDDCLRRDGRDGYRRVERHHSWEVLAKRANMDVADRADAIITREHIWSTYSDRLGDVRYDRSADGHPRRFQVFISREVPDPGADGQTMEYCGPPVADAVVILPTDERGYLKRLLAHELFHAFSAGAGDGQVYGWWDEATATWGEMQFTREDGAFDESFLQRPGIPLDDVASIRDHEYGAWRFVQWLEGRTDVWRFMIDTFQAMGRGADGTQAVAGALSARGRGLGLDLAEFWGDHLRPENPLNGPATRGQTVRFPADEPSGGGDFVDSGTLHAERLAAGVARFRLFRDSNVQSITIRTDPTPPGTYLWVQNGDDLEDWTDGDSASFCVGGFSRTTGAKAWPGEFPVAYTNGHRDPGTLRDRVELHYSAEECDGFVRDPSAAIDDSPSLELPESCPDTPVYFHPPHGHTDYFVLRERMDRVYRSQVDWQHAALMRVERRDLGQRAAGRLFARWTYCSARRASHIDHLPDELIRGWMGEFVRFTRRAAHRYENGNFFSATDPLQKAGLKYAQIGTRATTQDIATAP